MNTARFKALLETCPPSVLFDAVVLPDGEVINLGGNGAEAIGYDLLGAFVGSEGTFGIATSVTVRLTRTPQTIVTLLADFLDLTDAADN